MSEIPFTQYLRPAGNRQQVSIERPEPIVTKARAIIEAGFRFEVEELIDGSVSLTICNQEEDLDGEITPNGPGLPEALDRMIDRFHKRLSSGALR